MPAGNLKRDIELLIWFNVKVKEMHLYQHFYIDRILRKNPLCQTFTQTVSFELTTPCNILCDKTQVTLEQ